MPRYGRTRYADSVKIPNQIPSGSSTAKRPNTSTADAGGIGSVPQEKVMVKGPDFGVVGAEWYARGSAFVDVWLRNEVNTECEALLTKLRRFQHRAHDRNPVKAFSRRRYVAGFHEIRKYIGTNSLRIVFVAEDISGDTAMAATVDEIRNECKQRGVHFFLCSCKLRLAKCLKKLPSVSSVGVKDYDGTEDILSRLLEVYAKFDYRRAIHDHVDQASLFA